ncbi:membrane fusogenic activity family protein [Nocardiopsis dassonvillei]|uniref:membrane fusogenic activity family protein n=1 Tax=Nocardiopsis dassonvillei TaxID=2014 RepID=UPI0008FC5199|nr:membrane fusogenic activity family protein [Nocardiopsis dassonvillei]APC36533.1 membrane fusogenic activity family protein [Nocardiopsis dassonvillei]
MVVDAVRTYLDAASGLTELSRKQAVAAAKALLRANGPAAPVAAEGESLPPRVGQSIQNLAGELIETSQANRAAIADLVRSEVGRQLERMDVVPRADHERLVRRVAELERRLAARHAVERVLAPVEAGASSPVRPAAAAETDASQAEVSTGAGEGAEAGSEERDPGAGAGSGSAASEGDAKVAGGRDTQEAADDGAEASADAAGAAADAQDADKAAARKPRTAAKTARARTAAKRTTKSRGTTKK